MYVILTSKTGKFRSEGDQHLPVVEAYDYFFYGSKKARFDIARLQQETRVRVTEEEPPHVVNLVPTKFLEHFDSLDAARAELHHLTRFGNMQTQLLPCVLPGAAA